MTSRMKQYLQRRSDAGTCEAGALSLFVVLLCAGAEGMETVSSGSPCVCVRACVCVCVCVKTSYSK